MDNCIYLFIFVSLYFIFFTYSELYYNGNLDNYEKI